MSLATVLNLDKTSPGGTQWVDLTQEPSGSLDSTSDTDSEADIYMPGPPNLADHDPHPAADTDTSSDSDSDKDDTPPRWVKLLPRARPRPCSAAGLPDGLTDGQVEDSNDGRNDGRTDGLTDGLTAGLPDGLTDGQVEDSNDGRNDGRTDGLTDGLTTGLPDGLTDSQVEDSNDGHNDGRTDGLTGGLTDGLTDGPTDDLRDIGTDDNDDNNNSSTTAEEDSNKGYDVAPALYHLRPRTRQDPPHYLRSQREYAAKQWRTLQSDLYIATTEYGRSLFAKCALGPGYQIYYYGRFYPTMDSATAQCATRTYVATSDDGISVDAADVPYQYASYADHACTGDRRCNAMLEWDDTHPGVHGQPVLVVTRPVIADEPIRFDYGPNYDYSVFSRETRTLQEIFEANAEDYSPAWGDVSAWIPLHVYDERGVPNGDPVCMSPTTRALWPQAPSPVVRALQLQCDHRRVYMRSFNAKAERRLARQFLNEWHATTTTTKTTVSSEASTLKGLRRDLSLSINGNAIDARPRCRQHRTIGPTSTIRAPKDPARHRESSPLTNRLLPSCEK